MLENQSAKNSNSKSKASRVKLVSADLDSVMDGFTSLKSPKKPLFDSHGKKDNPHSPVNDVAIINKPNQTWQ